MAIDVANRTTGGLLNSPFKESSIQSHFLQQYFLVIRYILQLCVEIDEEKLKWSFRLYDMDNNGVIDMEEMCAIIETLDSIEGVKPGAGKPL